MSEPREVDEVGEANEAHNTQRASGRPSAESGPAVTRDGLLEVAARLIADQGFSATSIRGLAREAGVSHGTVQHHFPTKQALWEALVDEVITPSRRAGPEADESDVEQSVVSAISAEISRSVSHSGLSGAILLDASEGAESRLSYLADANRTELENTLALLERLKSEGSLRAVDPRVLAALIGLGLPALVSATTALSVFFDIDVTSEADRDHLAGQIGDIILNGIIPRSP